MAEAAAIEVTLLCSPAPRCVREFKLSLPRGATVADAIGASGLWREISALDPKVARRKRFARQGARAGGLFAKRRAAVMAGCECSDATE